MRLAASLRLVLKTRRLERRPLPKLELSSSSKITTSTLRLAKLDSPSSRSQRKTRPRQKTEIKRMVTRPKRARRSLRKRRKKLPRRTLMS